MRVTVLPLVWILLLGMFSACEEVCDPALDDEIGGESLTVEYRKPNGQNYLQTVWNPNQAYAYLDTTGGVDPVPSLEVFRPGHENGKFGPFSITDRFINPATDQVNGVALYGTLYRFNYHLVKDFDGEDILTVEFFYEINQCNRQWKFIRYYLNDSLLPEYTDQRQVAITIVE